GARSADGQPAGHGVSPGSTASRAGASGSPNVQKAASVQATYQLHLRGHGQLNLVFDEGTCRIEDRPARQIDCHILADPAAFLMVFWQRQSQWNAIAKGQLAAWGRKPWLGLKFRSLIRNP
ncbi:MAG TPA: SCP2 sterol-binding domain-containing protein, partial [Pseudonocardiaceae bacterium]